MPVSKVLPTEVRSSRPDVSLIVPISEQADLRNFYETYAEVLQKAGYSFEFVFVLEGDFPRLADDLSDLKRMGAPVNILALARSFGEAAALTAGFSQAMGRFFLTVPTHFQVVPEGVTDVLRSLEEGNDVVVARREPRVDSFLSRFQDTAFSLLSRRLTGVALHDLACRLTALRPEVARDIHLYGELHRFIPLLANRRGFRVSEVAVPQHPDDSRLRVFGPGVYLSRFLDLMTIYFLTKFTKRPLRFFGLVGATLFCAGFVIALTLTVQKIAGLGDLADRPLLVLGVLLMVLGVQTGSIGLLGEIIVFTHGSRHKDYRVERVLR